MNREGENINKKIHSVMMLTLLSIGISTFPFNIQRVEAVDEVTNDIFFPRVTYETGPWAYAVAVGDLNSDGLKDVVVTSSDTNSIDVFIQNSLGTLNPRVACPISSESLGVAVGDVNGDSKDDVVATNMAAGSISVLIQNPLGSLNPQVTYTVEQCPISVKIGDLNSDGLNDVVVTNCNSETISVLTQNSSGLLNPQITYAAGFHPWGVAVGDVNSDGKIDVVAGNLISDTISVYLQTASGTLLSQIAYAGCDSPRGIDIGDVNGDGRNDVVVANGEAWTVGIFTQNAEGDLNPMVSHELTIRGWADEGPMFPVLGDVNSDGLNDMVVSIGNVFNSAHTINVFVQEPTGILNPPFSLLASDVGDSRGVAICDLNGDERNDLVAADGYEANTVSVYIQRIPSISAMTQIDPDALNLNSKGKWIACYIELPEGYDGSNIDISTVRLNGEIPAESHPTEIGDYDKDGVSDLMVKFSRRDLIALLSVGETTLTITGEVNGALFEGSDIIRVID